MLSFFPRDVLDEMLNLLVIESVSEGFPTYSFVKMLFAISYSFWSVGYFGFNGPLRQSFSPYWAVSGDRR